MRHLDWANIHVLFFGRDADALIRKSHNPQSDEDNPNESVCFHLVRSLWDVRFVFASPLFALYVENLTLIRQETIGPQADLALGSRPTRPRLLSEASISAGAN